MKRILPRRVVFGLLLGLAVLVLPSCSGGATGGGAGGAATQPLVVISAPPAGAAFTEGNTVAVQATSADQGGITRVELYVDGQLVESATLENPSRPQQYSTVHQWTAAGPGAHTLTVRAYNVANLSGERSVAIAVTGAGGAPTEVAAVVTATAEPTTPPDQPTEIPTEPPPTAEPPTIAPPTAEPPTAVPPTAQPPTAQPPTAQPPTPTITPAPLVFNPPFPGGAGVGVSWSENGLYINAVANDSRVGQDDGDGIDHIDIVVQDLQGNPIASRRENNKPYCMFGDTDGVCNTVAPGTDQFHWPNGGSIEPGNYLVRATAYAHDGRVQAAEQFLRLNYPPDSLETLFVNFEQPTNDIIDSQLEYEVSVDGEGAAAGIDRVEMFIVRYDGKIVNARTERSAKYCGFSGGETNPCNVLNFVQNQFKFPSGEPIQPTLYLLRVIAYANDGNIASQTKPIEIHLE